MRRVTVRGMKALTGLLACGLASVLAACSSDSTSGANTDGGTDGSMQNTGGSSKAGSGNGGGSNGGSTSGGSTGSGGKTGSGGGSTSGGSTGSGGKTGSGGTTSGGGGSDSGTPGSGGTTPRTDGGSHIEHVFVITMENHDSTQIVGSGEAPYINDTLIKGYSSSSNFNDLLDVASIPSEPHYVLLEAGTNVFSDRAFTDDSNPSDVNSTASTAHLTNQLKDAGVSWMSYQEGLDATSGDCPINTSGFYAPKHDPFIFFKDVSGSPPSTTNAYCVAHHKPYSAFADDLKNDKVAAYNFITPNQCHDMHGQGGCTESNTIIAGDNWLKDNLPDLITYANTHAGVIFIVWDEGVATAKMPFLAIGPTVKKNHVGTVNYNHRSVIKTVETIFGVPFLDTVKSDNDFADLFEAGTYP